MITNDRQYKIAKSQIDEFSQSLADIEFASKNSVNIHPLLFEMQITAVKSKIHELVNEVKEYEDLRDGRIVITEVKSLKELPVALIKARIANKLTQSELADKVGVKMQQIQRYEAEMYETASLSTLLKIAGSLNLSMNAEVQIKKIDAPELLDVSKYPFKQMFQRKWFGNFSGTYNDAVLDSKNLLEKLFELIGLNNLQFSLTKKSIRAGSDINMFALNAWYARVLIKAQAQAVTAVYNNNVINEFWLKRLAELSLEPDSPLKAAEYLINSGIRFIIEPHLEGTFLDGAALLLNNKEPVIAMTLRHDRLDNFWFVLFHELAHVRLHLSNSLTAIFDDLDKKIDGIEHEADEFALNSLIPESVWRRSLVRFSPSNQVIINEARSLNVHPSLVAGRIRRETGKYYMFTDLVGQGEVRKHFVHELNQ